MQSVTLYSHDAFEIVDGSVAKPTTPAPLVTNPAPDDAAKNAHKASEEQYTKELKDFLRKHGIAQKFIVTSMGKRTMMHILHCKTAKEIWGKLHGIYESRSETSVYLLQQKWFSFKKGSNDDISSYISKIEDLAYSLNALQEPISDCMLMTKILMTLPANYYSFKELKEKLQRK